MENNKKKKPNLCVCVVLCRVFGKKIKGNNFGPPDTNQAVLIGGKKKNKLFYFFCFDHFFFF